MKKCTADRLVGEEQLADLSYRSNAVPRRVSDVIAALNVLLGDFAHSLLIFRFVSV